MKGEQQEIRQASGKVGADVKKEHKASLRGLLNKMSKGTIPKNAFGLTDAMVEGIYGQAYRLYNTGKYQDAIQVFRLLVMINAMEKKYVMGLAACFHMMKKYSNAAETYSIVAVMDPQNPIPFYHASDCFVQIGDVVGALVSLESAVKRCGDKPEFSVLKGRALLSIESLKKEIEKKAKINNL